MQIFCWGFLQLFHQWYWPIISFFVVFLSGFGIRVMWTRRMSSEVFLSLLFFWNRLRWVGSGVNSYIWQNSPVKPSSPRHLFVGSVLITDLIWLLVICPYFLFLSDSVLGDCTFLETYPFLLDCPFYWHIIIHSSVLWSFVFLWCQL